ncbi:MULTISPECIES: hypothetical protein [Brevundimonas]|uniref:hypothetical protein n=1 Tax=Brevundimonas sp. UBA7507 TaxID=1946137 RepID=UPI00257AE522|nr:MULTISPECIES: hypothetical protein [Brevundimonas]
MSMTTPRVTVPVEPTEAMMKAADAVDWSNEDERASVVNMWQAMLSAAPAPEGGAVDYRVRTEGAPGITEPDPAIATREEAPAEAGEDVNWKAEYEAACAARISDRQKSQEVINERDKWVAELLQERAALRAQPPAREDAQPVAEADRSKWISDARDFTERMTSQPMACEIIERLLDIITHPARDALRVAVEALEKIADARVFDERGEDYRGIAHPYRACRADETEQVAIKALAVLQAEQKGGALWLF